MDDNQMAFPRAHVGYGKQSLHRVNRVVNHILLCYHGYACDCA